ncbi:MAG: hypothetical protein CV087_18980 [Candidatus Brocadia sp. WS118]|nr:MAG: hypothetical protein CV087_18980 [Candidatus Brocadia sp. WS118]
MRPSRNRTVKKILFVVSLFLLSHIPCAGFAVLAQPVPANPATSTASSAPVQPLPSPLPEIPPTPRSKLEIIQYILLPIAIGASIWLILHMDKMEREETKENEGH